MFVTNILLNHESHYKEQKCLIYISMFEKGILKILQNMINKKFWQEVNKDYFV